jgi:hypothetical protein
VALFGAGGANSGDGLRVSPAASANETDNAEPTTATIPAIFEPANHFIGGRKRK